MGITREEYEEKYGEVVGRCNVHNHLAVDNICWECYADANKCPECEGTNLNEDGDTCFDCAVEDFRDSYSRGDYYVPDARQE